MLIGARRIIRILAQDLARDWIGSLRALWLFAYQVTVQVPHGLRAFKAQSLIQSLHQASRSGLSLKRVGRSTTISKARVEKVDVVTASSTLPAPVLSSPASPICWVQEVNERRVVFMKWFTSSFEKSRGSHVWTRLHGLLSAFVVISPSAINVGTLHCDILAQLFARTALNPVPIPPGDSDIYIRSGSRFRISIRGNYVLFKLALAKIEFPGESLSSESLEYTVLDEKANVAVKLRYSLCSAPSMNDLHRRRTNCRQSILDRLGKHRVTLDSLMKVGGAIAEINPLTKAVFAFVDKAYDVIIPKMLDLIGSASNFIEEYNLDDSAVIRRALEARGSNMYGPVGTGILFIDARERRHILPLEFFETPQDFHKILLMLFKRGAGGRYVARGFYNLSSPAWPGGQLRKLSDWSSFVVAASGMQLEMSVLIQRLFMPDDNNRKCPACKNVDAGAIPRKGRIECSKCYVSYQVTEAFIEEVTYEVPVQRQHFLVKSAFTEQPSNEPTDNSGKATSAGTASSASQGNGMNAEKVPSMGDHPQAGETELPEEDEIRLLRRIDLALEKKVSRVLNTPTKQSQIKMREPNLYGYLTTKFELLKAAKRYYQDTTEDENNAIILDFKDELRKKLLIASLDLKTTLIPHPATPGKTIIKVVLVLWRKETNKDVIKAITAARIDQLEKLVGLTEKGWYLERPQN
ncbi:hypothetical protein BD410DRAFT_810473 [Rickenella mellea]|uniref:Ubiquitin-like domain-containing protein n=1 Tax=Rickenella mellea TaxID=50990 RepID=A0A4Y7PGM6_9AGAM|nr:hypothetical protein BD410DRAFT_810473 [Rickenella mellea]